MFLYLKRLYWMFIKQTILMKKFGSKLLFLVLGLILIQACGPSEEEKRAAEQARMDSLRAVQQQQIAEQMAAMQDSLDTTDDGGELTSKPESKTETKTNTSTSNYNFVENGMYAVQVGAFRSEDKANGFVAKWKDREYPSSYVVKVGNEADGDVWFRVRIGFFDDKAGAEALGAELAKEINSGYWVSKVR